MSGEQNSIRRPQHIGLPSGKRAQIERTQRAFAVSQAWAVKWTLGSGQGDIASRA